MTKEVVSVIIPAFNQADYLRVAIQSALNQTYSELEVLVVDDGSTDHTAQVVLDLIKVDSRLKYLKQDNDKTYGLGARNWGMLNATGEWIALLDQDDLWYPNKIAEQLAAAAFAKNIGCVFCPVDFINKDGITTGSQNDSNLNEYFYSDFLKKNRIYVSSGIFKRHLLAIAGLPNESSGYADWWLWLSISKHTRVIKTNAVLAAYRIQENSFQQEQLRNNRFKFAQDNMLTTLSQFGRVILSQELKAVYRRAVNSQAKLYIRTSYQDLASFNVVSFLKSARMALVLSSGFLGVLKIFLRLILDVPIRAIWALTRQFFGQTKTR
jgi:teichuronic acid biosynthesis glycosyltransferase TuaG